MDTDFATVTARFADARRENRSVITSVITDYILDMVRMSPLADRLKGSYSTMLSIHTTKAPATANRKIFVMLYSFLQAEGVILTPVRATDQDPWDSFTIDLPDVELGELSKKIIKIRDDYINGVFCRMLKAALAVYDRNPFSEESYMVKFTSDECESKRLSQALDKKFAEVRIRLIELQAGHFVFEMEPEVGMVVPKEW